jgi:hypothetical protein
MNTNPEKNTGHYIHKITYNYPGNEYIVAPQSCRPLGAVYVCLAIRPFPHVVLHPGHETAHPEKVGMVPESKHVLKPVESAENYSTVQEK